MNHSRPPVLEIDHTPTPESLRKSAAHWRMLADIEESQASFQESIGLPHGDVSTFRYRAAQYRQVAAKQEAQAAELEAQEEAGHGYWTRYEMCCCPRLTILLSISTCP